MARKPATSSVATVFAFGIAWAAPPAFVVPPPTANVTTRAPPVFRKSRRDALILGSFFSADMIVSLSCHLLGCAPDRAQDARMRAAAAQVRRHRILDLVVGRLPVDCEQGRRLHHHPVDAIAALDRLLVDERLLHRMQLAAFREASSVTTFLFPTNEIGTTHERIARPSTCTVQAPHWPRPQPKRGPCRPASSRNA